MGCANGLTAAMDKQRRRFSEELVVEHECKFGSMTKTTDWTQALSEIQANGVVNLRVGFEPGSLTAFAASGGAIVHARSLIVQLAREFHAVPCQRASVETYQATMTTNPALVVFTALRGGSRHKWRRGEDNMYPQRIHVVLKHFQLPSISEAQGFHFEPG